MDFFEKIGIIISSPNPAIEWSKQLNSFEICQVDFDSLDAQQKNLLNQCLHIFEKDINQEVNYQSVNDLTVIVPSELGWFVWFKALERINTLTILPNNWVDEFFQIAQFFEEGKENRVDILNAELRQEIIRSYTTEIMSILRARLVSFGQHKTMQATLLKDSRVNQENIKIILQQL